MVRSGMAFPAIEAEQLQRMVVVGGVSALATPDAVRLLRCAVLQRVLRHRTMFLDHLGALTCWIACLSQCALQPAALLLIGLLTGCPAGVALSSAS